MIKFVLIVGLPGSGKTTYANSIVKPDEIILDDISKIEDLKNIIDKNYKKIYITDPHFCLKPVRENAEKIINEMVPCQIEWIFFENNVDKCMNNIKHRNDGRKISLKTLMYFSQYYNPPENCLKIWQNSP